VKAYSYKPIFQKTVLANGVRVVTESHPFTRAVSVGIFVEVGTRHENPRKAGLTHFLEHMVFKGTRKRSAYELAKALEAVGGDLNAYTAREYTCFHATSLKEHLPLSLDVVTDLVTGALLTRDDFEKEREVIVQEIQMCKDNLEEYILDMYLEKTYEGQDLATPILGTEETLAALKRADLLKHYDEMFRGPNIVVSVSGPVEHDQVLEMVSKTLGKLSRRVKALGSGKKPRVKRVQEYIERPSEQVHLMVGWPSCSYKSGQRFESFVVNELLGGGVTSRFYQKVREDKGLVYSVYSFLQSFVDSGLFLTYAGTAAKNAPSVLRSLKSEMEKFMKAGVKERELTMFKTQVKGQILLGTEDMENRMNSLGINEMAFGEYRPVDRVIEEIEEVTVKSVSDYVRKYFDPDQVSLMVMGELAPAEALKLLEIWE
jgi:predicted Zn-dependent peptidase